MYLQALEVSPYRGFYEKWRKVISRSIHKLA